LYFLACTYVDKFKNTHCNPARRPTSSRISSEGKNNSQNSNNVRNVHGCDEGTSTAEIRWRRIRFDEYQSTPKVVVVQQRVQTPKQKRAFFS